MVIDNKFNHGDLVYLKTDKEQEQRMITALVLKPNQIEYQLSCGLSATWHFECEITETKNELISL